MIERVMNTTTLTLSSKNDLRLTGRLHKPVELSNENKHEIIPKGMVCLVKVAPTIE